MVWVVTINRKSYPQTRDRLETHRDELRKRETTISSGSRIWRQNQFPRKTIDENVSTWLLMVQKIRLHSSYRSFNLLHNLVVFFFKHPRWLLENFWIIGSTVLSFIVADFLWRFRRCPNCSFNLMMLGCERRHPQDSSIWKISSWMFFKWKKRRGISSEFFSILIFVWSLKALRIHGTFCGNDKTRVVLYSLEASWNFIPRAFNFLSAFPLFCPKSFVQIPSADGVLLPQP